jgi:hypothetical protein
MPDSRTAWHGDRQDAERKVKELEAKLLKIAIGVRKERELKATEVNELKATNDKLAKQMELYQERLTSLEKEMNASGGSKGVSAAQQDEQLRLWRQKADDAEERAKRAEMDAQDKISDYKIKVKHLLVQQEAKFKEQSGQHSSTAAAEEAERRCRALEQRNRELEAALAAQSSAGPSISAPPMSMGAPPPPPPAAAVAAPPPPPPPSGGGATRSGQPASLMDAIKQGTSLKKAPAGGAPKPKPAGTPQHMRGVCACVCSADLRVERCVWISSRCTGRTQSRPNGRRARDATTTAHAQQRASQQRLQAYVFLAL